jgi:putative colanic acid biosysnthesis UDP-glucose lipid carrier transferase
MARKLSADELRSARTITESAMTDVPAAGGGLSHDPLTLPQDEPVAETPARRVQDQAVRFGSHEPALLTLVRHGTLPLIAIMCLAATFIASGRPLSLKFCALSLITFLIASRISSPLDLRNVSSSASRARSAAPRIMLEWSCIASVLYFAGLAFQTNLLPREALALWYLSTPIAMLVVDSLCVPLARRLAADQSADERYVIIGANDVGLELARRIDQSRSAGTFFGFLDYRGAGRLPEPTRGRATAGCSAPDFAEFVRRNGITRVYLALPLSTAPRIESLVRALRDTTASIYFVPNVFAFDLVQPRCVEIDGMPAFAICDSPMQGLSAIWKRAFDFALAAAVLLLFWPVFLGAAVAIKLSSPGPVIFKQRRYGLNGEEIEIYKFRSMTVCEDGAVVKQASEHDQRVTPIGSLLRRTSMDELPQVFNVLEGKMSFVGPRPHAVAHNEEYRKLICGYMIRHKVRPGITGWAQVHGLRGETSTVEKMQRRVQYDIEYLKNWSFGLDLKIIARTALTVLGQRNAY